MIERKTVSQCVSEDYCKGLERCGGCNAEVDQCESRTKAQTRMRMKTPDKIKKGLKACAVGECHSKRHDCPYSREGECTMEIATDALAYIQQLETREWKLFDLLSSAWYGKQYYFKQYDGTVYSRKSCECLTFDQAIDEFAHELTVEREGGGCT